jgi:hypothetical protein
MQVMTAPVGFGNSDCERISDGVLAQPVLTLTSLAYVAAGIAVLWWAMRLRAPLAVASGVAIVAVGAGSFVYSRPPTVVVRAGARLADHRRGSDLSGGPGPDWAPDSGGRSGLQRRVCSR